MIAKAIAIWMHYKVWDSANKVFLAGDVANHTLQVIKDGVLASATNTPQEIGGGHYRVLLTASEVNGLFITLGGVTSTADAYIIPRHMLTDVNTRGVALVVQYTAWDTLADAPKAADDANHTISVAEANASAGAANAPSEVSAALIPGVYSIVLEATETDGPIDTVYGTSSTADIVIMPTSFPPDPGRYTVSTDASDSIRKQIIDTLAARFATILISEGYKTNLGSHVFHWYDSQIEKNQLPALSWEDADANQTDETVGQVDNVLNITCKISANSRDDVYDARADLIKAMGTDVKLGGLAGNTTPPSEIGQVILNENKIWTLSIEFDIEYPTDRFDPYTQ